PHDAARMFHRPDTRGGSADGNILRPQEPGILVVYPSQKISLLRRRRGWIGLASKNGGAPAETNQRTAAIAATFHGSYYCPAGNVKTQMEPPSGTSGNSPG